MNITQIKLILKQPLPIILKKVRTLVIEKVLHNWWSFKYSTKDVRLSKTAEKLVFSSNLSSINEIPTNTIDKDVQSYLATMYLNHRFDLLGTGWVKNNYYSKAPGIEGIIFENTLQNIVLDSEGVWLKEIVNANHLVFSKFIWKIIKDTDANYQPIDWQKDYKSGFRFDAKKGYIHQADLVQADGIDLKMPWELSRFQHLPQLAIFYKNNPDSIEIIKEFKCQLLDFIMTNPFGMGVNWSCTMDVGIRAANISLAFDWFKQLDKDNIIDQPFEEMITNSLYFHGLHIVNNLEYKEGLTSNHYLGNIAGLTFISSYLQNSQEVDFWLAYSIQELGNELNKQFFYDGSNFEGSTAYHRLSGEMMVYCLALLHKVSENRLSAISKIPSKIFYNKANFYRTDFTSREFLSPKTFETIYKMAEFTDGYTKPNREITQVGDNDSGRFFKFSPCGNFLSIEEAFEKYSNLTKTDDYQELSYWDENNINHDSFVAAINGFFDAPTLSSYSNQFSFEFHFIKNLSNKQYGFKNAPLPSLLNESFDKLEFTKSYNVDFDVDINTLNAKCFIDFGFVSIKNENFYFSMSFGANKKSHHSWGHHHNDKGAVELQINGKNILRDSGTYIYTPLPKKRNEFRSSFMHNSIIFDNQEQNIFNTTRKGLFSINSDCQTELIKLSSTQVVVKVVTPIYIHFREVIITNHDFTITDYCNKPFEQNFNSTLFSNGYGKRIETSYYN